MRASVLLFLLCLSVARGAAAQAPAASPSPEASLPATPDAAVPSEVPTAVAASPEPPPPSPQLVPTAASAEAPKPEETLSEGEIRIRADSQGAAKGHFEFRGFVDLRFGDTRIQSDKLDFYTGEQASGATERKIVAEGNVVFLRGDERLSGDKLVMDLNSSTGMFDNAVGYMNPGVFVHADKIERLDGRTYKITDGTFTSCAQPNPRWSFSAGSATLVIDDKLKARNVTFRVKDVPAFYLPYFIYPLERDQRATGFLMPSIGYESLRGFKLGTGFFWAMGRSYDQTLTAEIYPTFGYGFGHEFRYLLPEPSRGNFRTYFFRDNELGAWDHDLDWSANQQIGTKTRATLQVREYSDTFFRQQTHESLDLLSSRSRYANASLQRSFGPATVQLFADSTDTFFGSTRRVNRHLPTLKVNGSPQKIGRTGIVYGYEARAENLTFGDPDAETALSSYGRVDLYPRISRPFSTSFLQLNPELRMRYTRWGASQLVPGGPNVGPSIDRRYLEGSLEMRGPTFSRVFNAPDNVYSERFKHVIGPEVTWTYRSRIEEFQLVPKFDGADYVLGTNEVSYALVNRLYAKRPGRGGKLEAHEFFNWRLAQTYYVQIADQQSEFDPNYSSAFYGPGGVPTHYSPLSSRMRLRPFDRFTTNFDVEYDVNFKQMRSLGVSTSLDLPRFSLQGGWWRGRNVARREENRVLNRDTLRGSARLDVIPSRFRIEGSADYDILAKNLVQNTARATYSVQCCGFSVEAIQSDFNQRQDRQFRFSIELANIGSVGSFMGDEQSTGGSRQGGFK